MSFRPDDILIHREGNKGKFIKRYKPTGMNVHYIVIELKDGSQMFAPENEFIKIF